MKCIAKTLILIALITISANFVFGQTGLQFNGSNQYVTFGAATSTLGAQNFTLECWFKRTGTGVATTTGGTGATGGISAYPLITKGRGEADASTVDANYFLGINAGTSGYPGAANVLVADFEEGTSTTSPGLNHPVCGVTAISNNVWYHAAVTYDSPSRRWQLFLNGVLEKDTVIASGTRFPQYLSIQHAGLATAFNSTGVAAGYFAGIIDEPRIWNYARTQQQIQDSMNVEITSSIGGLLGRWGLNEGTGTTAGNTVSGSPAGTLTNTPTWVAGNPGFPTPPPVAPSGLTATAGSYGHIQLTWTDNSSTESNFEIARSTTGSGGTYTLLATLGANVTSYTDVNLNSVTEYCYKVRATNAGGPSAYAGPQCATTLTEGDYAMQLGSSNAYVTFGTTPDEARTLGSSTFTLELWFKRLGTGTSITTGGGGIQAVPLLTKGTSDADGQTFRDINYFLGIRDTTNFLSADFEEDSLGASKSLNHPITGVTAILQNVWYHAAVTYDGTTFKLYLNGNLERSLTVGQPPAFRSKCPAALGSSITMSGTAKGFLNGVTDEARIWNYARSQSEIQSTINSQITSSQTGLIARWGLNEGSGTVVNGSAGTVVAGSMMGSGYSWITPGAPFDISATPPTAPSGLTATAFSSYRIDLSWIDNSSDESSFEIDRSTVGSGGPFTLIKTLAANVISYSDTGLTAATEYWYRVRAVNSAGSSTPSNVANDTTLPLTPPLAPSGLSATPTSSYQVNLSWTDNSDNENNFEIERSTTGIGGTYSSFITVAANTTSYNDLNLNPSTEYCYRVRATNAGGPSSYADPACASTPAEGDYALRFGSGNAYVTFGQNSTLGVPMFTIETWFKRTGAGSTASTGSGGVVGIPLVSKGLHQSDGGVQDANYFLGIDGSTGRLVADFEDYTTGLNHPITGTTAILNDTWYHAAVTYNGTTWNLYLNGILDGTLLVGSYTPRYDSRQHAGLGVAMDTSATTEGHFDGVLDEVRIWDNARSQSEIQSTINSQITSTQTGLVARWGLNEGSGTIVNGSAGTTVAGTIMSTGYSWVTPGAPFNISATPPTAPSSLTASVVSTSQINLGWTDNSSDETSFEIDRSTAGSGGPFTLHKTLSANVISYSDTGLTAATEYWYRVRAVNSAGSSTPSNVANDTTLPLTPPVAPSGLNTTAISAYKINLSWTDNSNDEINFQIERSTTGTSGPFNSLATVAANTISYIDSNLIPFSEYCYRIRAVNAGGNSDYTTPACATTLVEPSNALKLGANNSYVNFGDSSALHLPEFTIETWFRRDGNGVSVTTGTGGIPDAIPLATKGTSEAENSIRDINYFLGIRASDSVLIADFEEGAGGAKPSQNHPIAGVTHIQRNVWYHAAATYDGTAWNLFLNGVLDSTKSIGQPVASATTSPAAIGSSITSTGTAQGFFDGTLDEAHIWNYARTQTQIKATINSQLTSAQPGLVARWALNEESGTVVHASAGTTVNGTIVGLGSSWVNPGAPFDITFSHAITATAGSNGTIAPSGVVSVIEGADQAFTITPSPDYHIDSVVVDGVSVGSTTSYIFYNVVNNHTISAYFSITCSPLTINPTTLPDGVTGVAYSQTLEALAGTSPYTFVVSSGLLPNGLSLASDGIISGSPLAHGESSFTVTATDANGCTGNKGYSLTINCASITLSPTTVPAGDSGVVYNQTITASGGIAPYAFTLTNGTLPSGLSLSSAGELSGTTDAVGSYNIAITATDAIGCTGTQDYALTIYNNRPYASFTANPNPAACNQSVSFDASSSSHGRPDRSIVSYNWNYGDGNNGTGSTPTHAFSAYGSYTVTLTVTDNNVPPKTATSSTVVNVNQGNQPPVSNAGGLYIVDIGNSLILDGTASHDPNAGCGDAIVSYDWDINNDGIYGDFGGATPMLSDAMVTSLATSLGLGTHPMGLRVIDTFGASGTATTTITIYDNQPIASFTANPNPASCNQTISFNASGSSHGRPDRSIVSYEWNYGDGSNGTGSTPTHSFGAYGSYTVTLTVTDDNIPPKTATSSTVVNVSQGNVPPVANAGGPYTVDIGNSLILDGTASSDPNVGCGDRIVDYYWDINNDGVYGDLTGASPALSEATITSLGIGAHTIRLRVRDTFGAESTAATTITIYNNQPVASFTASPNPAACGQVVSFDASGSSHGRPDRSIVSYDWNYGDGNTGTGSTPTHAFSAYGPYTVTLTVTDNNVPPKTATSSIVVTVNQGNQPPVANAGGPYTVDIGSSLILDGSASNDPNAACGDAIVSYSWDINNDGTYDDLVGAMPTVSEATISSLGVGTHTIGLRVTDTFGATNVSSTTLTILETHSNLIPGKLYVRDDFNRSAQIDLSLSPPSFKWIKLSGQDDASASLELNGDSTISPVNSLGTGHFGGVAWDSLFTDTTQIGMIVKQKGGNGSNTSFFFFTRMSSNGLSTATGYCLRYLDTPFGTDQIMIQRIDPGVSQTTLGSFSREVEPGDTLVMKIESDKTMKAFIYGINGIRDSISVVDNTYNPSQWYCWIDGCVFGTPVKMDDFMLGKTIPLINPEFVVLPTAIDYGTISRGSNKIDSVTVTNSGLGGLSITSVISTNPQFTVNPTSATIVPSGSEKFYITYSPLVNGSQSSDIVFVYNAPNSPDTVAVTGVGSGFMVPTITSFTPSSGQIGTTVTIAGTNFNTTPTNNIVYFGGVRASVIAATSSSLQVTVPIGTTYTPISVTVDGLTAYSDKPFIVTFIADHTIDETSFAPKVDFTTGANPHFVVSADIDGDNKPDLVAVNGVANSLSILRNTSVSGSITEESFATKVDFAAAAHTLHASVGDIDGDGKLDVVTTSYDANLISVFRNTSSVGSVSFESRIDIVDGTAPLSTAIRDLDGDGRPDLVIVSSSSVVVYRNLSTVGNISFAPRVDFMPGINGSYVAIGDIDGDNKPDLVVTSLNGSVSVLRNVSTIGTITDASFTSPVDLTIGNRPYSVAIGDIDGDGKSDLVVASQISNNVSILRNTSTSGLVSFDSKVDFGVNVNPYIVTLGDLDGDGKIDMAVSCADSSKISVLHNTATSGSITSGSFEPKVDYGNGVNTYTRGVAIGDLDGDGKPELIAANEFINSVSVFRNVMIGHPKFLVTPSTLSFGSVDVTTNKKDSVVVTNTGAASLNISSVAVTTGEFSVTPNSGTIAISESMKFYITFTPSSAGVKLDTVNFTHDATGSPSHVPLSGTGTLPTYSITSSANGPGSIAPTPTVSVTYGSNQTFAITPNTGAHIDSVLVDGIKVDSMTSYTFNNVMSNHTIASYFSLNKYTITATAGANGTINPSGTVTVNYGSNQSFIMTANEGYFIDSVVVDGVKVDSTTSYTFNNVITTHTIHVDFSVIHIQAWGGGTNTNWNDATNWNPPGVPTSSVDVIIGSTGNPPALTADGVCANLVVQSGVTLALGNFNLTISGNATVSGNITFGTGRINISGQLTRDNITGTGIKYLLSANNYIDVSAGKRASSVSSITIQPFANTYPPYTTVSYDSTQAVKRYYIISNVNGTGLVTLSLDYLASEKGSNFQNPSMGNLWQYRNSGPWVNRAGIGAANYVLSNGMEADSLNGIYNVADANAALPVQLSSFTASYFGQSSVTINWTTISEVNNYGFYVQKLNAVTNSFVRIDESFKAGQTNSTTPRSYSYTDKDVSGSEVQYRLEQIDNNSLTNYYGPIIVSKNPSGIKDGDAVPAVFKLTQNFPNPFNPSTKISFSLATAGYTTLKVYNIIGQEVATLYNGVAEAGRLYVVNLDATNLNSGIYFCKLVSGSSTELRKIVLLK